MAAGKDVCLGCHGPFDKLIASGASFTMPDGTKVNPHRYVPHDKQDASAVTDCTDCHKPHPIPLTSKEGLPKPDVEACYSCHHMQNFKLCNTCHE
jgi:predicted CXXCH cytochrome family protein